MSKSTRVIALTLLCFALGSVLMVACARAGAAPSTTQQGTSQSGGSSSGNSGASGGATVHMSDTNFVQSSVTLNKGEMLTLIDDTSTPHIIQNGSWNNGSAQPVTEKGAPKVDQSFAGNDTHQIGPFNTAGTFHLYCTIHSGMNLTVIVK